MSIGMDQAYKLMGINIHGDDAVTTEAKLFFRDTGEEVNGIKVRLVLGLIVDDGNIMTHEHSKNDGMEDELWECEVTIKPRRKYHGTNMYGSGADGVLTSGGLNPGNYTLHWPVAEAVAEKLRQANAQKDDGE